MQLLPLISLFLHSKRLNSELLFASALSSPAFCLLQRASFFLPEQLILKALFFSLSVSCPMCFSYQYHWRAKLQIAVFSYGSSVTWHSLGKIPKLQSVWRIRNISKITGSNPQRTGVFLEMESILIGMNLGVERAGTSWVCIASTWKWTAWTWGGSWSSGPGLSETGLSTDVSSH